MRNCGTWDALLLRLSGDDTDPDPGIYRIFIWAIHKVHLINQKKKNQKKTVKKITSTSWRIKRKEE